MAAKKIWYLETLDSHTDEVVSSQLSADTNAHEYILCIDSKKRELWECPYRLIAKMIKSRRQSQLDFKVFYRVGRHGPVREWPFAEKKKLPLKEALKKGFIQKGAQNPVT